MQGLGLLIMQKDWEVYCMFLQATGLANQVHEMRAVGLLRAD